VRGTGVDRGHRVGVAFGRGAEGVGGHGTGAKEVVDA
jgi:hypothetical protein